MPEHSLFELGALIGAKPYIRPSKKILKAISQQIQCEQVQHAKDIESLKGIAELALAREAKAFMIIAGIEGVKMKRRSVGGFDDINGLDVIQTNRVQAGKGEVLEVVIQL